MHSIFSWCTNLRNVVDRAACLCVSTLCHFHQFQSLLSYNDIKQQLHCVAILYSSIYYNTFHHSLTSMLLLPQSLHKLFISLKKFYVCNTSPSLSPSFVYSLNIWQPYTIILTKNFSTPSLCMIKRHQGYIHFIEKKKKMKDSYLLLTAKRFSTKYVRKHIIGNNNLHYQLFTYI